MNEKKKILNAGVCPVCGKQVEVPENLKIWETKEEYEKATQIIQGVEKLVNALAEIVNHHPEFESNYAKKMAISLTILEDLMDKLVMPNAIKLGILSLVESKVQLASMMLSRQITSQVNQEECEKIAKTKRETYVA
jgi:hypothetical protein